MNHAATHLHPRQRGMSLVVVLLLLVIVSMLGVASMQIAGMGEHGARNDRDMQLSLQSAEAALIDAEVDLQGIPKRDPQGKPVLDANGVPELVCCERTKSFRANNARFPASGCASGGKWKGMCALETDSDTASWLAAADFEADEENGVNRDVVSFGDFTGRSFHNAGVSVGLGIQPALPPRYVIENVTELSAVRSGMVTGQYNSAQPEGGIAPGEQLYRVTAMGFGPRSTTQTVLQTIYRN